MNIEAEEFKVAKNVANKTIWRASKVLKRTDQKWPNVYKQSVSRREYTWDQVCIFEE
jgi:hypothetical protein